MPKGGISDSDGSGRSLAVGEDGGWWSGGEATGGGGVLEPPQSPTTSISTSRVPVPELPIEQQEDVSWNVELRSRLLLPPDLSVNIRQDKVNVKS